ncbi:MAG: hypothetical protein ACFHHU_17565 [Porticoccaceae bacterium]
MHAVLSSDHDRRCCRHHCLLSATTFVSFRRLKADWYVHLQSSEDEKVNIAILQGDHETIPAPARGKVSGLLLNFEVEDVDAEYDAMKAAGLDDLASAA